LGVWSTLFDALLGSGTGIGGLTGIYAYANTRRATGTQQNQRNRTQRIRYWDATLVDWTRRWRWNERRKTRPVNRTANPVTPGDTQNLARLGTLPDAQQRGRQDRPGRRGRNADWQRNWRNWHWRNATTRLVRNDTQRNQLGRYGTQLTQLGTGRGGFHSSAPFARDV